MKNFIIFFTFLVYQISCGQKNNYNKSISYHNEYLDQIIDCHSFVTSKSDYLFYDNITSVYVEKSDGAGKITGTPLKSYFDKDKNTIKTQVYDNPHEYKVAEFFNFARYDGHTLFKILYQYKNGEIKNLVTSEVDSINHIIIIKRFEENKLSEIDSVFYIKNFKPIEIRTSSVKYIDKSIRKIAYNEQGRIYKEVYQRNRSSFGNYTNFNELGNRLYVYSIKLDEYDGIPVEYENDVKEKEQEFIWYNDKDFEFRELRNSVITFNYLEKKMVKTHKESTYTTFFNKNLLPFKKLSVDKKYGLNMETIFEYNKHNDLISEKTKNDGLLYNTKTFNYVYDTKNNWIERKEYENGKLIFVTKRIIEY